MILTKVLLENLEFKIELFLEWYRSKTLCWSRAFNASVGNPMPNLKNLNRVTEPLKIGSN